MRGESEGGEQILMLVDEMGMWFTMVGKMRIMMKIISNIIQPNLLLSNIDTIWNSCFMKQFSRTKKNGTKQALGFLDCVCSFLS